MDNFKGNKNGFTLIELIVVMIIISILVLLATPRFLNYIERARYTQIINDIRVVETVGLAEMARNDMAFPLGTEKEDINLFKAANEKSAYGKDGLIVRGTGQSNFRPNTGNISDIEAGNIESGYYKLNSKDFIRPETRSKLRGDFYLNKEGFCIYVDTREASGNTEVTRDDTGLFTYASDDLSSGRAGIITGLNLDHDYWKDKDNKISFDGKKAYRIPDIPDLRIMEDASETPVTEIGERSFSKDLDTLGLLIGEDFIGGPNLEKIGDFAFSSEEFVDDDEYSSIFYRGKFIAGSGLKTIGDFAFLDNQFTGGFNSENITSIGKWAFYKNKFNGSFIANDGLEIIDDAAFAINEFQGPFNSNRLVLIGEDAFNMNNFSGEFITGDALKTIGDFAFDSARTHSNPGNCFTGNFQVNNIESIGENAFDDSVFKGDFIGTKIKVIGTNAFDSSSFRGELNIPVIARLGSAENTGPFKNSDFSLIKPNYIEDVIKNNAYWTLVK